MDKYWAFRALAETEHPFAVISAFTLVFSSIATVTLLTAVGHGGSDLGWLDRLIVSLFN